VISWLYMRRPREVAYIFGVLEAALIWKVYVG
jgi:hypothetical protein